MLLFEIDAFLEVFNVEAGTIDCLLLEQDCYYGISDCGNLAKAGVWLIMLAFLMTRFFFLLELVCLLGKAEEIACEMAFIWDKSN